MDENMTGACIFLSHHSSKVELAEHLSRYLEKRGLSTWYAPRNIRSGEQWDEAINTAIQKCRAVVLLFCKQADASMQVKRELSLADKYKKPVFWIRVEGVEPNKLSYFLTSTQWFDWLDSRDDTLEALVRDIKFVDNHLDSSTGRPAAELLPTGNVAESNVNSWTKGVFAFANERDAAECVARVYFLSASTRLDSSLVLPTGRSATMVFRAMLRLARECEGCPFHSAHIISDTETFGVWCEHETSRTKHVNDMLIEPLKKMGKAPPAEQMHLLSGVYTDRDPIKDAQRVIRLYPPAVHAVSVSPVGEILAYEVGIYNDVDDVIDDAPCIVEVGEHSKKYIDPNQPSKSIISIGMGTALSAEILLILAFDMQKANIVSRLFNGPITAGIPATILKKHRNAFVITVDKVAQEAGVNHLVSEITNPQKAAEMIAGV